MGTPKGKTQTTDTSLLYRQVFVIQKDNQKSNGNTSLALTTKTACKFLWFPLYIAPACRPTGQTGVTGAATGVTGAGQQAHSGQAPTAAPAHWPRSGAKLGAATLLVLVLIVV